MARTHFTIATLCGLIALAGVGFAALRENTDWWARFALNLTLVILAIAAFQALRPGEAHRPFWLPMAVFGWGYFALSNGLNEPVFRYLATTKALGLLNQYVISGGAKTTLNEPPRHGVYVVNTWGVPLTMRGARFFFIGHCYCSLLIGYFAGLCSLLLPGRRDRLQHP